MRPRLGPRNLLAMTLAMTLALLLAACGGAAPADDEPEATATAEPEAEPEATESPDAAAGGGAEEVTLVDFAFEPGELTVAVGTEVTFVNDDSAPHTATHGVDGEPADDALFDLRLEPGDSDSFTFDEAGTYEVTCTIHPAMNMTITVEG